MTTMLILGRFLKLSVTYQPCSSPIHRDQETKEDSHFKPFRSPPSPLPSPPRQRLPALPTLLFARVDMLVL